MWVFVQILMTTDNKIIAFKLAVYSPHIGLDNNLDKEDPLLSEISVSCSKSVSQMFKVISLIFLSLSVVDTFFL